MGARRRWDCCCRRRRGARLRRSASSVERSARGEGAGKLTLSSPVRRWRGLPEGAERCGRLPRADWGPVSVCALFLGRGGLGPIARVGDPEEFCRGRDRAFRQCMTTFADAAQHPATALGARRGPCRTLDLMSVPRRVTRCRGRLPSRGISVSNRRGASRSGRSEGVDWLLFEGRYWRCGRQQMTGREPHACLRPFAGGRNHGARASSK